MVTPVKGGADPPHTQRLVAEGFGDDAEAYDRARPRYPRALADAVVATLPGTRVLDVGIGTGLSALAFRAAGCAVAGVEPDARMAGLARRRGFPVDVARFELWQPAGRLFDGVISGQAWHWIDPLAGAVKASQALAMGGRLALFWNAGDPPSEIAEGFADVYRGVATGLPFTPWASGARSAAGYQRFLDAAGAGIRQSAAYTEPESFRFDWQTTVSREAWLDQVPTAGGHHRIPPAELEKLLSGMAAVIDAAGGSFTMNYATLGLAATRTQRTTGR